MDKVYMPVLLTKRKITRRPEQALHMAIAKWLTALENVQQKKQFTFFHCPNGENRTKKLNPATGKWYSKDGERLKIMGLKPGIHDIILLFPKGVNRTSDPAAIAVSWGPRAVWTELKVGNVPLSEDQEEWAELLTAYGFEQHLLRVPDASFQSLNFAINFFQKLLRDNGVAC